MRIDDPLAELGLTSGVSDAEIRRAYRRLAAQWHPDRNPSPEALAKMQRLNRAYELLTTDADPFARAAAHGAASRGQAWADPWEPFDEADLVWEPLNPPTPKDIRRKVTLTLEEAAMGAVRLVSATTIDLCATCSGAGKLSCHRLACAHCDGDGRTWWYGGRGKRCTECAGTGDARRACTVCRGSGRAVTARAWNASVRLPAGVRAGDIVTARGLGQRGAPGSHGDLELEVALKPHALFDFDDDGRLRCVVPLDLFSFLSGARVDVPTLSGEAVDFDLARGRLQVFDGLGIPNRDGTPGALVVTAGPVFPTSLNAAEIAALQALAGQLNAQGGSRCPEVDAWRRAAHSVASPAPSKASASRRSSKSTRG